MQETRLGKAFVRAMRACGFHELRPDVLNDHEHHRLSRWFSGFLGGFYTHQPYEWSYGAVVIASEDGWRLSVGVGHTRLAMFWHPNDGRFWARPLNGKSWGLALGRSKYGPPRLRYALGWDQDRDGYPYRTWRGGHVV